MNTALQIFDDITSRITMYKGILFGLVSLLLVAELLAVLDIIGINPLGLVVSFGVLAVSCYVSNKVFARLWKAADNSESWLITACILACIVTPKVGWEFVGLAALTGAIAMASKYAITWRQSHFLNPAAVGAFVVSVTGLLSVNWWIATPALLPVTAGLAVVALRKQRRFITFFVFAAAALITMLLVNMGQGQAVDAVLRNAFLSWPLVFLGSVMLTEPITLPSDSYSRLLVATGVGVVFAAQIHVGPVSSAPHTALLVGNILAAVLAPPFGAWLTVRRNQRLAPDIVELTFAKPPGLRFKPGQYLQWTLPHRRVDLRGNRRSFSVASAPAEDEVRLAVRIAEKGSSYKAALAKLKSGQRIRVTDVSGNFTLPPDSSKILLIAGGIGITPFRSMIAQLVAARRHRDIVLLYIATSPEQFIWKDLFAKAGAYGVRTEYIVDRLFSADELHKHVADISERHVYISGPNQMVHYYEHMARSLGVPRKHMHKDYFNGY